MGVSVAVPQVLRQCHSKRSNPSDSNLPPPHYRSFPLKRPVLYFPLQSFSQFITIQLLVVPLCLWNVCPTWVEMVKLSGTGHSQQHKGSGIRSRPSDAILSVLSKKLIAQDSTCPISPPRSLA